MATIGNIIWFIFGGLELGLCWLVFGVFWCCTIIGIPFGIASFRIMRFCFFPFGKELIPCEMLGEKRIAGTAILNFIWIIFSGLWLSIEAFILGAIWCCTIIGIPFGLASFNIGKASFAPLGKRVVNKEMAAAARANYLKDKVAQN